MLFFTAHWWRAVYSTLENGLALAPNKWVLVIKLFLFSTGTLTTNSKRASFLLVSLLLLRLLGVILEQNFQKHIISADGFTKSWILSSC